MKETKDVIIVGGGPCGLACAIEAQKAGLNHLVIEKGNITESIRNYPRKMNFFSTAEMISIGDIPFPITGTKPSRDEALQYYRKVAAHFNLNIKSYTKVEKIQKETDNFTVSTNKGDTYQAKNVVIATGYFNIPRKLEIPGEDLPHVSHYYDEPYRYAFKDVVIVGGGNSTIETALELHRHDVNVTVVCRKPHFKPTIKYWIKPDIENRIKEGSINAIFNAEATEIRGGEMEIKHEGGKTQTLTADFVLLLTGYLPDTDFLQSAGVKIESEFLRPDFNPDTYQTNIEGLYVCGTVAAGTRTETVFIENGRHHAALIAKDISGKEK